MRRNRTIALRAFFDVGSAERVERASRSIYTRRTRRSITRIKAACRKARADERHSDLKAYHSCRARRGNAILPAHIAAATLSLHFPPRRTDPSIDLKTMDESKVKLSLGGFPRVYFCARRYSMCRLMFVQKRCKSLSLSVHRKTYFYSRDISGVSVEILK